MYCLLGGILNHEYWLSVGSFTMSGTIRLKDEAFSRYCRSNCLFLSWLLVKDSKKSLWIFARTKCFERSMLCERTKILVNLVMEDQEKREREIEFSLIQVVMLDERWKLDVQWPIQENLSCLMIMAACMNKGKSPLSKTTGRHCRLVMPSWWTSFSPGCPFSPSHWHCCHQSIFLSYLNLLARTRYQCIHYAVNSNTLLAEMDIYSYMLYLSVLSVCLWVLRCTRTNHCTHTILTIDHSFY